VTDDAQTQVVVRGRRSTRLRWSIVVAVAVLGTAAGCGDDDTSAEEQVCDARSDVREALDDVADHLASANLGEASEAISEADDAYDELVAAVDDLGEEQRESLAPDVDALESEIAALQDTQDFEQLREGLDEVLLQAQVIYDDIADTVSCD
jgi:hypothetical protein